MKAEVLGGLESEIKEHAQQVLALHKIGISHALEQNELFKDNVVKLEASTSEAEQSSE